MTCFSGDILRAFDARAASFRATPLPDPERLAIRLDHSTR
jgi:hypothetical protein